MNQKLWSCLLAGLAPTGILILYKALKQHMAPTGIRNLKAFLCMIQYSEGTYGAQAYNTLYGGDTFNSYVSHPDTAVTKGGITSTAAGAYQMLYGTWTNIQQDLHLPDFSPVSQDRAAIELIRRRGALDDVLAGRITAAIEKCRKEWASLPGAGYGQREQKLQTLVLAYQKAGGTIAA